MLVKYLFKYLFIANDQQRQRRELGLKEQFVSCERCLYFKSQFRNCFFVSKPPNLSFSLLLMQFCVSKDKKLQFSKGGCFSLNIEWNYSAFQVDDGFSWLYF